MKRLHTFICGVMFSALLVSSGSGQVGPTAIGVEAAQPAPSMQELALPASQMPDVQRAEAQAAQPNRLVYVGSEGSFLLLTGRSRGIFRWAGVHWANSISYAGEDANYWVYSLVGTNGWFAFARNPSGSTYVIWKGTGPSTNIQWQDIPNGWMRATRGPATGNLD